MVGPDGSFDPNVLYMTVPVGCAGGGFSADGGAAGANGLLGLPAAAPMIFARSPCNAEQPLLVTHRASKRDYLTPFCSSLSPLTLTDAWRSIDTPEVIGDDYQSSSPEFDSPMALLANPNSAFAGLYAAASARLPPQISS